jgi:hypothetical protein
MDKEHMGHGGDCEQVRGMDLKQRTGHGFEAAYGA